MSPAEHRPWSATDIDYDFGTVTVTHCCDEHARAAREVADADRAADPNIGAPTG
jgi:hypothetical protein